VSIRDGVGEVGGAWFSDNIVRKIGNGENTLFWTGHWVGSSPLCVQFRRLFNLAVHKSISVPKMFLLGCEDEGAGWQWRRRLWAWEEELLGEFRILLSDISL